MDKFEMVRFTDENFELDVRADSENETVWLTQEEMATLFGVQRPDIVKHVNKIINSKELSASTCSFLEQVQTEGNRRIKRKVKICNLDMIISVGYRVNSKRGIIFRRWASRILKDYLIQGYAINQKRLENLGKTIDIQNRMLAYSLNIDRDELAKVINEYTVMGMDINIFYTKQRFSRIEIPYGVESIPDNMFNHNNDIRFLVLSDTVTSVGVTAFAYCEHLLSVTLGEAMTTFGNSAFASCYRLVQLINHSSLNITHEDDYKYGYVSQATRQIISNEEDSKLFVDDNSFVVYRDNTVYLIDYFGPERDVVVPNEVNRIGRYALFGNPMTSITLGENTTYIEAEALRRCSNLKKIVLPNTFYRLESTALLDCPKLQYNEYDNGRYLGNDVNPYVYLGGVINNSITSFKFHPDCRTSVPKLFEESSSTLEHVDFGSSLVRIESQTTYNCRQLKTMVIPATVTYLGMYNFRGLDSLTDVFYGGSSYEEWAEFFANADYGNAVDTNLVRYYSETSPSDNEYTYWHYVDNVPTVW